MSTEQTKRPQDVNITPWYKKPQLPWLIITHVIAVIIGGAIAMNVIAFNNAQVQAAVDQRVATQHIEVKK